MTEQLALFGEPEPVTESTTVSDEALIPAWFLKHQDRLPEVTPELQFDDVDVQLWRRHVAQVFLLQIGPTVWRLSIAAPPAATIDIRLTESKCKELVAQWKNKKLSGGVFLAGGEIALVPWEPEISIRIFNRCGDTRQVIRGDLAEHIIQVVKDRVLKKVKK